MHRQHGMANLSIVICVVPDVIACVWGCLNVPAPVHLCKPTVNHCTGQTQRRQVRLLARGQTVILIDVLDKRSTCSSLQLSPSFREEEEISDYPIWIKGRWRWWHNGSTRDAGNKSNKLELGKVRGVAEFRN